MKIAPELVVTKWLNTNENLSLEKLRGKVIAIHTFQMLCPGCVLHGIPQAQKVSAIFDPDHIVVLGLHTVFEHHEGMQEKSLSAFLHEFRVRFPVAIDKPSDQQSIPQTMRLYDMQGTPSWLLIDRDGNLRHHIFGQIEDMTIGSEITKLALENQNKNINIFRKNEGA